MTFAADAPTPAAQLRGAARLAVEATVAVTDIVESMHATIARPWSAFSGPRRAHTRGITGGVYDTIRWTTRGVGLALDGALAILTPRPSSLEPAAPPPPAGREAFTAALNGVLGDHLARTGNPLAIRLHLRHQGRELVPTAAALAAALPAATPHVVLMVHGLCLDDRQWLRQGHDHGEALARDLGQTVLHVRYNSGLHVSENGRALAAAWPVPLAGLSIVAHSMGGLVARSACHYGQLAGAGWRRRLRHLVCLGTPHHGAPLEHAGRWLHHLVGAAPFARPLARLGDLRSSGITDLRHGNVLEEDWNGLDRFALGPDRRQHVPLPDDVGCFAIAAVRSRRDGRRGSFAGDGLVAVDSALGRHREPRRELAFAADRQWLAERTGHLELMSRPEVYERIRFWLSR
jgi:hypothetical protein